MDTAEIFKVLGDENRLRIMNLLLQRELCVGELELILQTTQSNTSRHLNRLRQVGLIEANKQAQWVHYQPGKDFSGEWKELGAFLKNRFMQSPRFLEDSKRMEKYLASKYTCQQIRENSAEVKAYLEEEEN